MLTGGCIVYWGDVPAVVSLEEDKTKLHITKQLMRLMRTTKVRASLPPQLSKRRAPAFGCCGCRRGVGGMRDGVDGTTAWVPDGPNADGSCGAS